MARKPKQKPQAEAPKSFDEVVPFDPDSVEEETPDIEPEAPGHDSKSRDWRDVERYKEMRRLRQLVDDDLDLDDGPRRR